MFGPEVKEEGVKIAPLGASVLTQQVNLPLASNLPHFRSISLLMLLEKQWKMAYVLGPCTHLGVQDGVPSSWFWPCPHLAAAAIWEVNLWMEGPSRFFSL